MVFCFCWQTNTKKDESAAKILTVIMLLVRLKSILNGVIDEIPDYGNVDPAVF